jgi:hypothetical protein
LKEKKYSAKDKSKKDAATNKISPHDGQLGYPLFPPALAVNDLYQPSPILDDFAASSEGHSLARAQVLREGTRRAAGGTDEDAVLDQACGLSLARAV